MGYLIAAILVLLLVAGFITFFVISATRRSGGAGPRDPGAEGSPTGIAAPDESELGTTSQHSGADDEGGGRAQPAGGDGSEDEPEPRKPESERLANRPR